MTTVKKCAGLVLVLVCVMAGGCDSAKEVGKTLGALAVVRGEIIKKFGENSVDIRANTADSFKTISVTFVNSPLNESDIAERVKRAKATAEIVKARYSDIKSVDRILVGFMRAQTKYFVFHWNVMLSYHGFDNEARPLPEFADAGEGSSGNGDSLRPTPNYSASKNQTNIQVHGIQLEGVAGNGLTMMPHLLVSGDTRISTPRAPAKVSFDFASFAEKQTFPGVTKVAFLEDQKILYETEGQFSTSRSNDGLISEFLYVSVPYVKYRQMISGKTLSVKLGERKYQLTDEQLKALSTMSEYVKD